MWSKRKAHGNHTEDKRLSPRSKLLLSGLHASISFDLYQKAWILLQTNNQCLSFQTVLGILSVLFQGLRAALNINDPEKENTVFMKHVQLLEWIMTTLHLSFSVSRTSSGQWQSSLSLFSLSFLYPLFIPSSVYILSVFTFRVGCVHVDLCGGGVSPSSGHI